MYKDIVSHVRFCNLHGSALIQLEITIDKGRDIVLRIDLQQILECCHLQMVVLLYMKWAYLQVIRCHVFSLHQVDRLDLVFNAQGLAGHQGDADGSRQFGAVNCDGHFENLEEETRQKCCWERTSRLDYAGQSEHFLVKQTTGITTLIFFLLPI